MSAIDGSRVRLDRKDVSGRLQVEVFESLAHDVRLDRVEAHTRQAAAAVAQETNQHPVQVRA